MNTKQLFLAISMIAVANVAVADQNKTRTAAERQKVEDAFVRLFEYNAVNPFKSCEQTISPDCDLITKHFIKAMQHNQDREHIQYLEDQMSSLSSDELLQRPVKRRLDEARQKHPYGQKSYWSVSVLERDALVDAAANVAEKNGLPLGYTINLLKKTLDN